MKRPEWYAQGNEGFSLLELTVTVAIIGVLLAIAVATYVAATGSANAAACSQNRKAFNKAIEVAICTTGTEQPDEMEDLRPYVNSFDRVKVCPRDGTPLLFDVTDNQVVCPNHP